MNLSKFTDYSFRVLIYLSQNDERLCTVEEMATNLDISENHLKKIVQRLGKTDFITSIKGRNGGLELGLEPKDINLGEVFKITEDNLTLVECFCHSGYKCNLDGVCNLKSILNKSLTSFIDELSKYTLEDIINGEKLSLHIK